MAESKWRELDYAAGKEYVVVQASRRQSAAETAAPQNSNVIFRQPLCFSMSTDVFSPALY
jgi:hypothetical protein